MSINLKPGNSILFAKLPHLSMFEYFTAVIDIKHDVKAKMLNDFANQKMISRRLIETYTDILVAPSKSNAYHIHLFISQQSLRQKDVKELMIKISLTLIGPKTPKPDTFLECINYTAIVKLSLEYIQIRNYFAKVGNVSEINETVECSQVEFLISDKYFSISIAPSQLKFHVLSLTDTQIDLSKLCKNGFANFRRKVFVLPNLKPATACKIYLNLPESSYFREYSDVQYYWRNLYGYKLPNANEEMSYIEVIFEWSNISYVYPIVCVYTDEPEKIECRNLPYNANEILKTMEKKFSEVFGNFVQINDGLSCHQLNRRSSYKDMPEQKAFTSSISLSNSTKKEEKFKCIATSSRRNTFVLNKTKANNPKNDNGNYWKILRENSKAPQRSTHNLDIATYAQTKELKKFTVSVLIQFCKENDIPVKQKEKKDRLMQKIYDFFAL